MTKIEVPELGEVNYKHLPVGHPDGVAPPVNVLKQEVVVENKPQPLRSIRPYAKACLQVPALLEQEAVIVLHLLFECFAKAKVVKEGLIGDLMWGFNQIGVASELTYRGLSQLEKHGYIKFQAPDNTYVSLESTASDSAFVRYQPSLLTMVYDAD